MSDVVLEQESSVFIMRMQRGENRFNQSMLDRLNDALDEVEAAEGAAALVVTGDGKFFSNGLDLDWMMKLEGPDAFDFVDQVQRLFARWLGFRRPTVAALNGHTFAAGAMFALCHDFRVMRKDRGYFCLPEVDIRIPFQPGMTALIQSKLTPSVVNSAILTGDRYAGSAASEAGIVDMAVQEDQVIEVAVAKAESLAGKDPATYAALKKGMYRQVIDVLQAGCVR